MSDVIMLCYHAVSPTWRASLAVTPAALERQLRTLVERGWTGATFTSAVLDPPARRTVAVTFDDSFLSVLRLARPILAELGLPATVFVPTSFAERRQRMSWDGIDHWALTQHASELESMDWRELRELADAGWELGSHTVTHPRLTRLDDEALAAELRRSRDRLEERLGRPCTSIAYPYGDVDRRVAAAAAGAGYECGAALSRSLAPGGRFRTPRIGVYHADAPWRYALKMSRPLRAARASRLWPRV